MRRIIGLTIILYMLLNTCAFAKSSSMNDIIFDLQSLGIVQGDENNSLDLEAKVTRAEFVKMVVVLLGSTEVAHSVEYKKIFDDVSETHWASKYIHLAAQLGIIKGANNGLFNPDDFITYIEAVKILVNSTGYGYYAATNGGYPDGYLMAANYTKISSDLNVATDLALSREQAMILMYNTLDVDIMVADNYGSSEVTYTIKRGNTCRSKLQDMGNRRNIREGKGIVTATATIWLKRPIGSMEQNQIEIDGILYDMADELVSKEETHHYLGQQVDFFVRYNDEDDIGEIINIKLTRKNLKFVIDSKDFSEYYNHSIEYWSDNKLLKKSFNDDLIIVKNGRIIRTYQPSDITVKHGKITLIDNDGDNLFNIMFIEEYGIVRVDEVYADSETIYFAKHTKYNNQNSIVLDSDEIGKSILYYKADGTPSSISDIKKDDILSICQSEDKDFTKIYISKKRIIGMIQEITEDSYSINDISYDTVEDLTFMDKVQVGKKFVLYLTYDDKIADAEEYTGEEESGTKYAYVIGMAKQKGLSGCYDLKLIIPGPFLQIDVLEDKTDISNKTTIKAAEGMNKDLIILKTADSIKFNNQNIKSENLASYLTPDTAIIYELNDEGDIKKISLPKRINLFDQKILNAKQLVFGKTPGGSFGTDEKTKVACVPKNIVEDDKDYFVKIKMNDNQKYTVLGYDINSSTDNAAFIVIRETMSYNAPGIISAASKLAVINSVSKIIDNDEIHYKVTLFSEGEMMSFIASKTPYVYDEQNHKTSSEDAINLLKKGDVVYYELNGGKEISGARIVRRLSGALKANIANPTGDGQYESILGSVQNIDLGRVVETSGNRADLITLLVDSGQLPEYEIGLLSNIPFIVYNTNAGMSVHKGDISKLSPSSGGNGDWVQITRWYGTITGVVIIK